MRNNARISTAQTIVVLGGSLVKEKGKWRTTRFVEKHTAHALGDRLRVVAAAKLYTQFKKKLGMVVWVSGGQGRLATARAPAVASVIKVELEKLGIPSRAIETEEHSGNTLEQLRALSVFLRRRPMRSVQLISNRYHLPRIQAMIVHFPDLKRLKDLLQNGALALVSAEEVLLSERKWRTLIKSAYASKAMKQRIASEKKGILKIQAGTYAYGSDGDRIIVLRKATLHDARFLYGLRNEKAVREASFRTNPISWEDHTNWLRKKLAENDSVIFIVKIGKISAGQVRFDSRKNNTADINIALSRKCRGKGYGPKTIQSASKQFFAVSPSARGIRALIKEYNTSSCRAFEAAGYRRIGKRRIHGVPCVEMFLEARGDASQVTAPRSRNHGA